MSQALHQIMVTTMDADASIRFPLPDWIVTPKKPKPVPAPAPEPSPKPAGKPSPPTPQSLF